MIEFKEMTVFGTNDTAKHSVSEIVGMPNRPIDVGRDMCDEETATDIGVMYICVDDVAQICHTPIYAMLDREFQG